MAMRNTKENVMSLMIERANVKMAENRERYQKVLREYGSQPITEGPLTVAHLLRGNRGVPASLTDTSFVHPGHGVQFLGKTSCREMVQMASLPEQAFWYMLLGDMPSDAELADFQADLRARATLPAYAWNVLETLPADMHPMSQLQTVTCALEGESKFRAKYQEGMPRDEHWRWMLEDGLDLLATLHQVAAAIYRRRFMNAGRLAPDLSLDWAAQLVQMLGIEDPGGLLTAYMRQYVIIHSDHEAANASANTAAIINSTLATMASTLAGTFEALSGPLHGMANQDSLGFIEKALKHFGRVPTAEEAEAYLNDFVASGGLLSGFGHAQLRDLDARFTVLTDFLDQTPQVAQGNDVIRCMRVLAEIGPQVLKKFPKIANPNPNIDFGSGAVLYGLGLTERTFFTVLFSISRMWGVIAQAVRARGEGRPIIRPLSYTLDMVVEAATKGPEALRPYLTV
jgi:citrate synthase